MAQDWITVEGAREHNLRDITVKIPRDKLTVVTGLSGSGKSSLAFDTLYAEGQRRYVESLSAYARQFLGRMQKPDVDHIDGLSPAISIEQRVAGSNPRSIVLPRPRCSTTLPPASCAAPSTTRRPRRSAPSPSRTAPASTSPARCGARAT